MHALDIQHMAHDVGAVAQADFHRHFRRMRSKTVTQNGTEMTVEVRISERQDLVGQLLDIPGVYDATLVSCQSEAGA